jgi:predicted DNA-binding transcriptional regulator YafY
MLPPTMLTPDELEALVEGLRHVGQDGNPRAKAARSLLYKIVTLLPQSGIEAES